MGSVKDVITTGPIAKKYHKDPTPTEFGQDAWQVKGTFSVKDLKQLIPAVEIQHKAEGLTLQTALFFEYFIEQNNARDSTCYLGVLDPDGNLTTARDLLDKGLTTTQIVMKTAFVPETYAEAISLPADVLGGKAAILATYRHAMESEELQCGVADVESIFRLGFPLGSSTFKRIFRSVGAEKAYQTLATYKETETALGHLRTFVQSLGGVSKFEDLETVLQASGLGETIPHPGHLLEEPVYDFTTKFEAAGDREITPEEAKELSGLDDDGYMLWTEILFPEFAEAQIKFCRERNIYNFDGKGECVAFRGKPVITDFACTGDENRLMIAYEHQGQTFLIPSNKEIQRALFTEAGIDVAISGAKSTAKRKDGTTDTWQNYFPVLAQQLNIDLQGVTEHSCNLMSYAMAEVTNRIAGTDVFDTKPLTEWASAFLPYASKLKKTG
ncbi:MAG: hypothetical protein KAT77_06380 [Nanoarchaeota archaeon]|nr:hypothetical protein [Nanoarchaeota archaeon]